MYLRTIGSHFTQMIAYFLKEKKRVLSESPGLVAFAVGLVNSVFNLPDRQEMFFEEFE